MNVLIIEDDVKLANLIQSHLMMIGEVDISTSAREGLQKAAGTPYDVFLVDVNLPDGNGVQLCKKLRSDNYHAPILMISGTDAVDTKIKALDAGANDYLVKPFDISELNARIRAVVRYMSKLPQNATGENELEIDPASRTVKREGRVIQLRKKEFDILYYMMRHAGKVISRNMLIDYLWGPNTDTCSNMVDVHFNYLRKKIDKPFKKRLLHTVHGIGYVFRTENVEGGESNEKNSQKSTHEYISSQ